MIVPRNLASIFTAADPSSVSTKRLAWAYGCSHKGSEAEAELLAMLVARIREMS